MSTSHFPTKDRIKILETRIIDAIQSAEYRWTRPELTRYLVRRWGVAPRMARSAIDNLLQKNEIAYTYQFGSSFLEISYNKPVRVSNTIVIKPPGCSYPETSDHILIDMMPGASFGSGQHPSTQLALKGMDFLVHEKNVLENQKKPTVLDVGTGSGILLIAAIKLGFFSGMGIDIDPCARAEARQNAALNGLETHVKISDRPIESLGSNFFMITANLRLPTIDRLLQQLFDGIGTHGFLVLSGIKVAELNLLKRAVQPIAAVEPVWQAEKQGWAALAIKKRSVFDKNTDLFD